MSEARYRNDTGFDMNIADVESYLDGGSSIQKPMNDGFINSDFEFGANWPANTWLSHDRATSYGGNTTLSAEMPNTWLADPNISIGSQDNSLGSFNGYFTQSYSSSTDQQDTGRGPSIPSIAITSATGRSLPLTSSRNSTISQHGRSRSCGIIPKTNKPDKPSHQRARSVGSYRPGSSGPNRKILKAAQSYPSNAKELPVGGEYFRALRALSSSVTLSPTSSASNSCQYRQNYRLLRALIDNANLIQGLRSDDIQWLVVKCKDIDVQRDPLYLIRVPDEEETLGRDTNSTQGSVPGSVLQGSGHSSVTRAQSTSSSAATPPANRVRKKRTHNRKPFSYSKCPLNNDIILRAYTFKADLPALQPSQSLRAAYASLPTSCHHVLAGKAGDSDQQRQYYRLLRAMVDHPGHITLLENKDLEWLCEASHKIPIPSDENVYRFTTEDPG